MRTREEAGRTGPLGRVRTIRRVALGGLWLAVRALAARVGLTLALIALTAFAVGVAAAGAMYLRAAGESLLQDGSQRPRHSAPGCWSSGGSRPAPRWSGSSTCCGTIPGWPYPR